MAQFNIKQWQEEIRKRIEEFSKDPITALQQMGVRTAYEFLIASSLLPVVVALNQDPNSVSPVLIGLVGGVGANLLTNRLQKIRDNTDAKKLVKQAQQPDLSPIITFITEEFQTFKLAQEALERENQNEMLTSLIGQLQKQNLTHLIDNRIVTKKKTTITNRKTVAGDQIHGNRTENNGMMISGGIHITGNRDVQFTTNLSKEVPDPSQSTTDKTGRTKKRKKTDE